MLRATWRALFPSSWVTSSKQTQGYLQYVRHVMVERRQHILFNSTGPAVILFLSWQNVNARYRIVISSEEHDLSEEGVQLQSVAVNRDGALTSCCVCAAANSSCRSLSACHQIKPNARDCQYLSVSIYFCLSHPFVYIHLHRTFCFYPPTSFLFVTVSVPTLWLVCLLLRGSMWAFTYTHIHKYIHTWSY